MASMKIKKGDMVKVIAGRDKDKEGKVIAVNKKKTTHSSLKALTWLPSMQSQAWQTSRAESFIRKDLLMHLT